VSDAVQRFEVRVEDPELAERLIAEVWAAGSSGVEDEGTILRVYAAADDIDAVRAAALTLISASQVGEPELLDRVDWSQEWKKGLKALVISERLVVRPPFVAHALGPGQLDLVIEPGQAFGTGGHESTRLALDWIDDLYAGPASRSVPAEVQTPSRARVLDVGTGSAVLAMAAVGLGADSAVGVDIDAVAIEEARETVRSNGFAGRVELLAGSLERLEHATGALDVVVANMLRSEVTPLLPDLAACLRPRGLAVFSGLLRSEQVTVSASLAEAGLEVVAVRSLPDSSRRAEEPADDWVGLLARKQVA
jgi:ribosomal protein L11 methyltransferase